VRDCCWPWSSIPTPDCMDFIMSSSFTISTDFKPLCYSWLMAASYRMHPNPHKCDDSNFRKLVEHSVKWGKGVSPRHTQYLPFQVGSGLTFPVISTSPTRRWHSWRYVRRTFLNIAEPVFHPSSSCWRLPGVPPARRQSWAGRSNSLSPVPPRTVLSLRSYPKETNAPVIPISLGVLHVGPSCHFKRLPARCTRLPAPLFSRTVA
jgi:hypothetical protein